MEGISFQSESWLLHVSVGLHDDSVIHDAGDNGLHATFIATAQCSTPTMHCSWEAVRAICIPCTHHNSLPF